MKKPIIPGFIFLIIVVAVSALYLGSLGSKPPPIPAKKKPTVSRVQKTTIQPEVIAKDFSIPANGTFSIPRQRACNVDNIKSELNIDRVGGQNSVDYTSHENKPTYARLWFYSKSGASSCNEKYKQLNAIGAFEELVKHKEFTIPPNSTVEIIRDGGDCNASSLTKDQKVKRTDLRTKVVYTSSENKTIHGDIVFYNKGNSDSCLSRLRELRGQGLIK